LPHYYQVTIQATGFPEPQPALSYVEGIAQMARIYFSASSRLPPRSCYFGFAAGGPVFNFSVLILFRWPFSFEKSYCFRVVHLACEALAKENSHSVIISFFPLTIAG